MSKSEKLQHSGLTKRVYYVADLVLQNRLVRALAEGAERNPIYRKLRFAARIELEVLFDAIALDTAWRAERINATNMMLDGDGLFVAVYGSVKAEYCSCTFYIWATEVAHAEAAKERILSKAGST